MGNYLRNSICNDVDCSGRYDDAGNRWDAVLSLYLPEDLAFIRVVCSRVLCDMYGIAIVVTV
jgi:hypothetical protein